jgi:hypothetical protein
MSRELTIAWANRNCSDQRVIRDVAKHLGDAERASGHVMLLIGRKLTRSRSPFLVASLGRDMFAIELSKQQVRNFGLEPNVIGAMVRKGSLGLFAPDPCITLTDVSIENASTHDPKQPVMGQFTFECSALHDGLTLRMVYDLPNGSTVRHYHYCLNPFYGRGTLKFRMSPLGGSPDDTRRLLPPTIPVIFTLCLQRPGTNAPDVPVSTSYAALIDLTSSPHQAPRR